MLEILQTEESAAESSTVPAYWRQPSDRLDPREIRPLLGYERGTLTGQVAQTKLCLGTMPALAEYDNLYALWQCKQNPPTSQPTSPGRHLQRITFKKSALLLDAAAAIHPSL